jgi:hypothetical protein
MHPHRLIVFYRHSNKSLCFPVPHWLGMRLTSAIPGGTQLEDKLAMFFSRGTVHLTGTLQPAP